MITGAGKLGYWEGQLVSVISSRDEGGREERWVRKGVMTHSMFSQTRLGLKKSGDLNRALQHRLERENPILS